MTLFLILFFFFTSILAVVGHFVLFLILRARGARVYLLMANVPFYVVIAYFRQRPPIRSKGMDLFAIAVAASVPLLVVTAIVLFPEMAGGSSLAR